ncbi:Txe/YoeB family addiction module toxin [Aequorivita sp. F47161]|jgi:toxin YoeB|uniref:Putative mRNA interferase YoeB n=1 Tax=Aequorivita vitellina TaxID=2874475 RepID=A0A9X1U2W1_9FLAO|nr:Txe/YoeB family addiction module toxin [Aequorivita vitellina]MCG2420290.1 Txe/YoeB family addiction module toxin [Aequorivita vitellina]MCZ4318783.1 Txe/YoeB family addiction module toxin [Aequorivita viscosa]
MKYVLDFTEQAKEDIAFHKKSGNLKILQKIFQLLNDAIDHPFEGLGKPEPLKYNLSGCWSRRINKEHRLVYEVKENRIIVLSLKGHY